MAKLIAQMAKCTAHTFPCASRTSLFTHPVSRVSTHFSRSITTTQCLKAERLYAKTHEWISVDGKIGTVGISDHAQDSLGDIVYAQLPDVESVIEKNTECGALESVKAVSELFTPVSGKIIEKNETVEKTPGLVNLSCYENGWLFKVELSNPEELKSLLNEEAYNLHLKSDQH